MEEEEEDEGEIAEKEDVKMEDQVLGDDTVEKEAEGNEVEEEWFGDDIQFDNPVQEKKVGRIPFLIFPPMGTRQMTESSITYSCKNATIKFF